MSKFGGLLEIESSISVAMGSWKIPLSVGPAKIPPRLAGGSTLAAQELLTVCHGGINAFIVCVETRAPMACR
ncbi:hypothetical protein PVAP13_9NG785300 [Panicum virgatum]|uniref:Uncharacterized protein n=1 Tax=Panicum virgatum TaxID=38727 RepID=A0A8T0NAC9_PANVG|nr:hypothetical protein PVAP13_9NG785300 [Panicum virgatum]